MDEAAAAERMRTLVEAILRIGSDLELAHVLERATRSACVLTDARFGFMLLLGPDNEVTDCFSAGLSAEEKAEMGDSPDFRGIVEMVRHSDRGLRLSVTDSMSTVSLPTHHPAVTSLVGVPVVQRDRSLGQLYVCNKVGAATFTKADENAVLALAAASGIAIENAHLYERERRRQQWLEAAAEVTHLLLGDVKKDQALGTVTRLLREVSGADYAGILLLDPTSPDTVDMEAVEGLGLEPTSGTRTTVEGIPAQVVGSGRGLVSADITREEGYSPPESWREALSVVGLGMVMPLNAPDEILGTLYVGWVRGSPHARPAAREAPLVEMFASQAALALQQVRAQDNRARLLVLEDRDRIASDLHDAVIQRLFAIGTRLHSAVGLSTRPEVRRRITGAIDALDETTQEVRSAIFQLHHPEAENLPSVRESLLTEVDAARAVFGFTPRLVLHGGTEGISPEGQRVLLEIVREAFALTARRGLPHHVEVELRSSADDIALRVSDEGAGTETVEELRAEPRFAALAARAEHFGGTCTIRIEPAGRTTLVWRVPRRR